MSRSTSSWNMRLWVLTLALLAGMAATTAFIVGLRSSGERRYRRISDLVQIAPRTGRRTESRLTGGFHWAPLVLHDTLPDEPELLRAVGRIILPNPHDHDEPSQHDLGVAHMLAGNPSEAERQLHLAIARAPDRAEVWSDLAAVRYELARRNDEPHRLASALAACDRALKLAPRCPEALFNRALIVTRLGLLSAARLAWRQTISAENDFRWREEARAHARLLITGGSQTFRPVLDDALENARRNGPSKLEQLLRDRPEDVRAYGESVFLGEWADALCAADEAREWVLRRNLEILSEALDLRNGDRMLLDAVRGISVADSGQRVALAQAYRAYRDARIRSSEGREHADEDLLAAAKALERAMSPMSLVARYYAANAMLDRNNVDGACGILKNVLRSADPNRHRSLTAWTEQGLGLCHAFRGVWTTSLLHLERSKTIFDSLGESSNAAFAAAIAGEVGDRTGRPEDGWRLRQSALLVMSRGAPPDRFVSVIIAGAEAESIRGDAEAALSLLQIAAEEAERVGSPLMIAETARRRAQLWAARGMLREASQAIAVAQRAALRIPDKRARARTDASVRLAQGKVLQALDPSAARETLTTAIEFYQTNDFAMLLPAAYLERGRCHLRAGDLARAETDFLDGIGELERQRSTVSMQARSTVFDTVPLLLAEAADLLLSLGRNADTYRLVERIRARTLVEALGIQAKHNGIDAATVARAVPSNSVLLEFLLLPKGVVVFRIDRDGLTVIHHEVSPARLRELTVRLTTLLHENGAAADLRDVSSDLYDELIRPVETSLASTDALILVPDRFLHAIPFAALYDRRSDRYLIEKHSITIAPSGGFLLRKSYSPLLTPALVVSDPYSPTAQRLTAARQEAAWVSRRLGNVTLLEGAEATAQRFLAAAPESTLIHYAGHAYSTDPSGGFLPLGTAPGERLDAGTIANLHLERTSLVVLAGCATMKGSGDSMEGMPSLARAFLAAGANTVIGTTADIDDRTSARLFRAFYRHLIAGQRPSSALRNAQCEFLRDSDPNLRHPSAWAPVQVLGTI